jgi:hypothetical protein
MIAYIQAIKRQFRDVYHFVPAYQFGEDLIFDEGQIPDGEYPMTIDGKLDKVEIREGKIYCCRFD